MKITRLNHLIRYIDKLNIKDLSIRFIQIGLHSDTYKIIAHTPNYLFEMIFTRYISTKGKVLFMCDAVYYTEQEIVEIAKNNIDEIKYYMQQKTP